MQQRARQAIASAKLTAQSATPPKAKRVSPPSRSTGKQSLVQQAYDNIKERIINLHFLPGQYLNEAAICAQLRLGRTPVHQALQRLQLEGLVDVLPRKGVIVQPDSIAEIMKILDSRLTVEPELARAAARRVVAGEVSATEIARLKQIATATAEGNPPDLLAFTANDRSFHREVAHLSGNDVMSDFARKLHERSTRFWYLNLWQTINVSATNRQHEDVVLAIESGDGELAAKRMFDHISSLQGRLNQLQRMSPPALRAPKQV